MTVYVYALREPGTREIRYIGKSSDPAARLVSHKSDSASESMREWMRSVRYEPILDVLEECASDELALEAERRLVDEHWSGRLLNSRHLAGARTARKTPKFTGFSERLRMVRKSRGLTAKKIQELTGISYGSISNLELRSGGFVSAETAVLLARALNVSVEYLVTGES